MAEKKKAAPKAAKEKQAVAEPKKESAKAAKETVKGDSPGKVAATVTLPPLYGALNVRDEPHGKIIDKLKNGQTVEVLDTVQHNGEHWAQIGADRFVNAAFLK